MKRKNIPESILRKLRKGGLARAAQLTPALRSKFGKRAWQTRIRRARKAERLETRKANNEHTN